MDAHRTRLAGRGRLYLFGELRIPGGGQAERDGKDGPQPVNDVEAEEQRDAEAAFLDGDALQAVRLARVGDEQDASGAAGTHFGKDELVLAQRFGRPEVLAELPGLLFEGHGGEQCFCALLKSLLSGHFTFPLLLRSRYAKPSSV